MGNPAAERAAEAAEAQAAADAELAKVQDWGLGDVLLWLVDQTATPHYARAGQPTADAVRAQIRTLHARITPAAPVGY